MNAADLAAPSLALALIAMAAVCAFAAATTRSLVTLALALAACATFATAALLCVNQPVVALALAVLGAGLTPAMTFAALALSARVVKGRKRRIPFVAIAGGVGVVAALTWALPDLSGAPVSQGRDSAALFLLAAMVFAGAATLVGVLGFGERGALEVFAGRADE